MGWLRLVLDHPVHAVAGLALALVLAVVVFALVLRRRTKFGGGTRRSAGRKVSPGNFAGDFEITPAGVKSVSAEFDGEAATLVDAAARWFQTGRQTVTIVIDGAAKLRVDGKGSGSISGFEFSYDGEQEYDVLASCELTFAGLARIAFTGGGTVRIGKDGIVELKKGGSLNVKDGGGVTLTEGAEMSAANLPSVSASVTMAGGPTISATNCEKAFGGDGMRLLTARCDTVYASGGDVFAYKCREVHASANAVVYAVRCDKVSATERSRVCHLQCGKVSKSDSAVLEEQKTDR